MPISQENPLIAPPARSGSSVANPHADRVHRVVFSVFLATTALACATALSGVTGSSPWEWVYVLHIFIAGFTTLAALARGLPLQNVVACALVLSLTSGMAMAMVAFTVRAQPGLGAGTLGNFLGLHPNGWKAWPLPLVWMAVVLASRQTAKVMLQPWRRNKQYGWWLLGVATALAWVASLVLEPFGRQVMGWWSWSAPAAGSWWGAPLGSALGALLLNVLLLLLVSPWMIPKRRTGRLPDFEPVWVWGGLVTWFALGNLRAGVWVAAGLGIAAALAVGWSAWQATRLPVSSARVVGGPASSG